MAEFGNVCLLLAFQYKFQLYILQFWRTIPLKKNFTY